MGRGMGVLKSEQDRTLALGSLQPFNRQGKGKLNMMDFHILGVVSTGGWGVGQGTRSLRTPWHHTHPNKGTLMLASIFYKTSSRLTRQGRDFTEGQ